MTQHEINIHKEATMKTNFENAVKILMEGRCESIRPEGDDGAMILRDDGSVSEVLEWKRGFGETSIPCAYVINRWECLGYKPEMETVEVKRWLNVLDGDTKQPHMMNADDFAKDNWVELKGSYQRPVEEKVKRRVELGHAIDFNGSGKIDQLIHNKVILIKSTLFAEWEE